MKILGIEFKLSNWGLPSNKGLKFVADGLLFTYPLFATAVAIVLSSVPAFALWVNIGLSVIVVAAKVLSRFTAEPVVPVEDVTEIK